MRSGAAGLALGALLCVGLGAVYANAASSAEQTASALYQELQMLKDEHEIRGVLNRYARGLDRHDVELESSAFWPDAQVNYGSYSADRDTFVAWGNDLHVDTTAQHEHHITNQTAEIAGDVAHVESYVLFLLRSKDEKTTLIGGARYIDKMERRNGIWRIAVRELVPDTLAQTNSVFAGEWQREWCPPDGCGTWNRADLSYRRPLERRAQPARNPNLKLRVMSNNQAVDEPRPPAQN